MNFKNVENSDCTATVEQALAFMRQLGAPIADLGPIGSAFAARALRISMMRAKVDGQPDLSWMATGRAAQLLVTGALRVVVSSMVARAMKRRETGHDPDVQSLRMPMTEEGVRLLLMLARLSAGLLEPEGIEIDAMDLAMSASDMISKGPESMLVWHAAIQHPLVPPKAVTADDLAKSMTAQAVLGAIQHYFQRYELTELRDDRMLIGSLSWFADYTGTWATNSEMDDV